MQFSNPKVSMEESCPFVDWPPRRRRPGGGSIDIPAKKKISLDIRIQDTDDSVLDTLTNIYSEDT